MIRNIITCTTAAAVFTIAIHFCGRSALADTPEPIKIVLHPSPETHPALKYQLLPPLLERRPGNAAVQYLKVPHEQTTLFSDKAFWETMSNWSDMPLDELRKDADGPNKRYAWIANILPSQNSSIFGMLERGSRCESCDWDVPIREQEFYSILLPDVQTTRSSASMLAARARLLIANHHYDAAVRTMQTGFGLGRNVGKGPTLIQGLVGVAICTMTASQVEALLQSPDSPNLYWALATLPRPLVDFRPGFESEFASIYLSYPELRDLDKKEYSPDEWRRLLQKTFGDVAALEGITGGSEDYKAVSMVRLLEGYPRAKRYLIEHGRATADVEAMPVPKVILLYTMQIYEELRDEIFRWMALPYPEARKGMQAADDLLKKAHADHVEIIPLATLVLPAVANVKGAEARMSQRIAAISILEALRIYAFDHDGRLPQVLTDITEVPIPHDPFTGEPFHYVRDGKTAKLESAYPSAAPLRYEIRMEGDK